MTALTARQTAWLTSELGSAVTVEQMQEKYDLLGTVRGVALAILRARVNALIESPLSVGINGVATVNQAENVKALERQIARIALLDDDPSDDTGGQDGDGSDQLAPVQFRAIGRTRSRSRRR